MKEYYKTNIHKIILSIFIIGLLISLSACSTTHRAVDNTSTVIPKNLYAKENKIEKKDEKRDFCC